MKHFIRVCVFLTAFTNLAFAQKPTLFDEGGYQNALLKSRESKKPVFFMAYATWCPHCNKMKKDVFTDPKVSAFLEQNFVCAALDIDKPEGAELKKKFGMSSFPSFVYLDEHGTLLYNVSGEMKPEDVITESTNALDPKKQLPYLKTEFEKDVSNADKCLAYIITLRKGKDRKFISEPAHQYLATQSEQQLASATNWRIIANAVTDINSREFKYVVANQAVFAKVASAERVERKITNTITELLQPYTQTLDTVNYAKHRADAKMINLRKTDSLIFNYDLLIAERTQNWKGYAKTASELVERFLWNDQKAIKEIAQNYVKNLDSKPAIENAVKWSKRALELQDSYDGNILLAKLYVKVDDKKQAETYVRKAKAIAQSLGWDSKDADEIYQQLNLK